MIDKQLVTTPILAAALDRSKSSASKRSTAPGTTSRDTATAPPK
jgi:hypothetical protein